MLVSRNHLPENIGIERVVMHRALRRIRFGKQLLSIIILPPAFNWLIWTFKDSITVFWSSLAAFWLTRLNLPNPAEAGPVKIEWLGSYFSWPAIVAPIPDARTWWTTLFAVAIVAAATKFLPEKAIPLRYFIWISCFIQLTSLIFFGVINGTFPYSLSEYISGLAKAVCWSLFILPWVHALIFYVFNFSLIRKALFTAITLGFVILALPLMLVAHSFLIVKASLLVMPLLYFQFGIPLLILACIAIYGSAMAGRSIG